MVTKYFGNLIKFMIDKNEKLKKSNASNEIFDLIRAGKKTSYNIMVGGPRFSRAEGRENLSNEIDLVFRFICSVIGLQNSGDTKSSASLVTW